MKKQQREITYKLYWKYLKKYSLSFRTLFFAMFASLIIATFLQIPVPLLFKKIVDDILPSKNVHLLFQYGFFVVFIVLLREFFNYLSRISAQRLKNRMYTKMTFELLRDFFSLPYSIVKQHGSGYFESRIFEEPKNLEDALTESVVFIIKLFFIFVFGLFACLHLSWRLTLTIFLFVPIYYLLNAVLGKRMRKIAIQFEEIKAKVKEYTFDIIQSFKFILIFKNAYKYVTETSIGREINKFTDTRYKYQSTSSMFSGFYSILSDSMPVIVFFFGVYEIMHGRLTIGGLIAFMELMGYVSMPLQHFSDIMVEVETTVGHIQRIEEIKKLKENQSEYKIKIKRLESIELRSIELKFKDKVVLENLSFRFNKGNGYIIRGDNGSGKTSLLDVLAGLLLPNKGDVIINGKIPMEQVDKNTYRECLSVAFFPPLLMPFVEENLRIVEDDVLKKIAEEHIVKGRKFLRYHELSSGEKQKLNIIIALSKVADFYMFDEPFTNMDKKSIVFFRDLIFSYTIDRGNALILVLHEDYDIKKEHNFETIVLSKKEVINVQNI